MTHKEPVTEDEMRAWAEEYAKKHGFQLNPDATQLATVLRGLSRNMGKHGKRYCPCRLRSGDEEKDKAIVCPCIYHEKEIEQDGSCHCNLYFRK